MEVMQNGMSAAVERVFGEAGRGGTKRGEVGLIRAGSEAAKAQS